MNTMVCRTGQLIDTWIPTLAGVEARLREGAHVADVGCGLGATTILMALAYPRSTFVGFEPDSWSVDVARRRADDAGVADRVAFVFTGSASYPGTEYDLVTSLDGLGEAGDLDGFAAHVRASLAPHGAWVIVESLASEPRVREVAAKGGFRRFRRAAETPSNLVFEARL